MLQVLIYSVFQGLSVAYEYGKPSIDDFLDFHPLRKFMVPRRWREALLTDAMPISNPWVLQIRLWWDRRSDLSKYSLVFRFHWWENCRRSLRRSWLRRKCCRDRYRTAKRVLLPSPLHVPIHRRRPSLLHLFGYSHVQFRIKSHDIPFFANLCDSLDFTIL